MKKPTLIGLTGFAGTGKDTVRQILERQHGYTGLALADPLRHMLTALLLQSGQSTSYINLRELKEEVIPALGVSYRYLMQTLGTEWGRAIHPDFWTRIAQSRLDQLRTETFGPQAYVISDVRFESEAQWIRSQGGVIWRVYRADAAPVRAHQSETEMIRMMHDEEIANNGTIDALEARVQRALECLA